MSCVGAKESNHFYTLTERIGNLLADMKTTPDAGNTSKAPGNRYKIIKIKTIKRREGITGSEGNRKPFNEYEDDAENTSKAPGDR